MKKTKVPNPWINVILIALLMAGCSPFKPQIRRSPEGMLPTTFSLYAAQAERPDRWWEEFNDRELNHLIESALSGSLTLKEAWARLIQARALAVQAGSALYPDLTANAGGFYGRQKTDTGVQLGRTTLRIKDHTLGLSTNYELDLWGRIRSEREAAELAATATREDLNAASMTLAAEVAERWTNIISQRMQKRLLQEQLKSNSTYLELVELRFRKSMVSALDVYQQRQVVEKIKAEIPLVEAREHLLLHELALLLGELPKTPLAINRETLPLLSRIPATGLPADLLAKRPDVRASGLRLKSADWQVAAARAARLPAISLTATAIYGTDQLDLLFDNWILKLAGSLIAPIFDGMRRKAEVTRTRAVADENLAHYRKTVLTAIKEVEDALINEVKQQEHIEALELQMDAAQKALDQALLRYRKGVDNYLPVLTQLLTVQNLERDLIQRHTDLVIYRVSLYRALGGTWMDRLSPDTGSLPSETRGDMDHEG
ncbi:MAG: efflux transporter outer membrane subunit [Thermodesulfobacteriota bacterium]|nr:efflux transporter outer membrane subunit [Thermodesulfobacteriota bacterium]